MESKESCENCGNMDCENREYNIANDTMDCSGISWQPKEKVKEEKGCDIELTDKWHKAGWEDCERHILGVIEKMIKELEGTPEYNGKTNNALNNLKSMIEKGG